MARKLLLLLRAARASERALGDVVVLSLPSVNLFFKKFANKLLTHNTPRHDD